MLVYKITVGFVVQVFDTEKKRFVSQEFVAGDQCDYEDNGELVGREMLEVDGKEAYLPFDMVQPHTEDEGDARGKQADRPRHCKTVRVPVEIAFTSDPAELDDRKDEPRRPGKASSPGFRTPSSCKWIPKATGSRRAPSSPVQGSIGMPRR